MNKEEDPKQKKDDPKEKKQDTSSGSGSESEAELSKEDVKKIKVLFNEQEVEIEALNK